MLADLFTWLALVPAVFVCAALVAVLRELRDVRIEELKRQVNDAYAVIGCPECSYSVFEFGELCEWHNPPKEARRGH